jgi:hypothetical protein
MSKQRVLLVTGDQKLAVRLVLGSTALDTDWAFETVGDLLEGINRVSLMADTRDRVDLLIVDVDCVGGMSVDGLRARLGGRSKCTPVIMVGDEKIAETQEHSCVLGRHFSDRQLTDAVALLMGVRGKSERGSDGG